MILCYLSAGQETSSAQAGQLARYELVGGGWRNAFEFINGVRKVTPQDLAATVFRHLEIPLDAQWMNPQGRPVPIVAGEGTPIPELV